MIPYASASWRRAAALRGSPISVLAAMVLVTVALSLGQTFLVPFALAIMLAFLLAPLSARLERLGLGRTSAVVTVCVAIGLLTSGVGWMAARELSSVVVEAPTYRENLLRKIATLRGPLGSVGRAADAVSDLGAELDKPTPGERHESVAAKVEVVARSPLLERLAGIVSPVADVLGAAAIVAVLAVFMLLQREDLRDRVIRLVGNRDLTLTTTALDDAGRRISRFLGMQALLCGAHGLMVGIGLLLLGIPGALLWGATSALFRFVPYIGPWIAAVLPIATAAGAFDGWTPALLCAGLFVVLELISNNLLEPWLYGASVGLSPFAIVFSAVFWSWLWGVPGLLLATPLSACLVVLGRHVRGLEFLSILLSNEPALEPGVRFYQRLLARDVDEAEAILRDARLDAAAESVADRVVLPALHRLARDTEMGTLDEVQAEETRATFKELLACLREADPSGLPDPVISPEGSRVVCVPALDANDDIASAWLASELVSRGVAAMSLSAELLVSERVDRAVAAGTELVCISALTPSAIVRARQLAKRMHATGKAPEILIGAWASAAGASTPSARSGSELPARWATRASELYALLK